MSLGPGYNYVHGNIGGTTIEGIYDANYFPVVDIALKMRENGLNNNYIVINNRGKYYYCIDTNEINNNESPIIAWFISDGKLGDEKWDNIYQFLYEEFEREIECIKEDEEE